MEAKIWNCQKYQVVRSAKKRPSANLSGRARLSAMPAMLRSIRSLALPNQITAYEVLLYKAEPTAQVAIQKSAGYAVFSSASRNVESRLDLHLCLRGLQPGAHAEPDAQRSSDVVSPGRSVSERR